MKLIYLRRSITFLAFWDAIIKPVGIIHPNVPHNDGETSPEIDGTPPKSLVLVTEYDIDFCKPLVKCPDTDEKRYWRKLCFNTSGGVDEEYHCGFDEEHRTIVEFYYRGYPCDKGFYGTPKTDADMVQLVCKVCPKSHFNPERRFSPTNMDQCSAHRHISPEENTVLFTPGTNSEPAVYYCDAKAGYASRHQTLFCKSSYQSCDCEFQDGLCREEDLLPDKRCVPKCDGERPPERNFSCVPRKELETVTRTPNDGLRTTSTKTTPDYKATPIDLGTTLDTSSTEKVMQSGMQLGEISGAGIFVVGLVIVILIIICKKGWRKWETNTGTAGHNIINIRDSRNVNVTVHESGSSTSESLIDATTDT